VVQLVVHPSHLMSQLHPAQWAQVRVQYQLVHHESPSVAHSLTQMVQMMVQYQLVDPQSYFLISPKVLTFPR
jgi:hypothetical protein